MIYSSIHSAWDISRYPPILDRVIKYLRETDFVNMACGEYELEGRKLRVQVFDKMTGEVADQKPESHKQYLDIQFIASGSEMIGCTPYREDYEVVEDLLKERDLLFYKSVENESFLRMEPGFFAVFFPDDVHRPACVCGTPQNVRKVVVKVHIDLL